MSFRPGQYLELTVPHSGADSRGTRRLFSIASSPGDSHELRFGVRLGEDPSSFKRALAGLEPDRSVRGTLVAGDFLLPASLDIPLLLVAGGIGITPFMSQLQHAAEGGERDIVLLYAVRDASELAYADHLEELGTRVIVLSPDRPAGLPSEWSYPGESRITPALLDEWVPDARSRTAFVSGPPRLVAEVRSALRRSGVRRIRTDAFSGY